MHNIGGIYSIKNIINSKVYIGSTKDFNERKTHHFIKLRNNTHHCIALQRAFNKYGEKSFIFKPIKICNTEDLFEIEQYFLNNVKNLYNSYKKAGYHPNKIGNNLGKTRTIEQRKLMSKSKYKDLSILANNKNGDSYVFENVFDLCEYLNLKRQEVNTVLCGRRNSLYGWKFKRVESFIFN